MKRLIILITIAGLFLLPMTAFSEPVDTPSAVQPVEQNTASLKPPPVAPSLVREGDFAVKLADALKIGAPQNEAAAESMLASINIAPHNGWIADYPVTPEIIGQLQNSIQAAVKSGKLQMSMSAAMAALQTVSTDFGLDVVVAVARGNHTAGEPAPDSSGYIGPAVVNNYYYDYGPPVITYYSPPPAYFYLYAWVPSPFWCAGFYFPGFFILNDFDTVIVVHHSREICTNHVFNYRSKRFFVVDPVNGRYYRSAREFPHFNRLEARKGSEAIYHRALAHNRYGEHGTMPSEFTGRNQLSAASGERFPGLASHRRGSTLQPMNRSHEEDHLSGQSNLGNSGQREFIRPPLSSERSYAPPSSMESPGRMGRFGNRGSFGEFHGGQFAGVPNRSMGHEGFHREFHGGQFAGVPNGSMGHEGFDREFHGGQFAGIPNRGVGHEGFDGGFHGGDFRR